MSIFDAYDQEFNSLCQEISKNISELKGFSTSDTEKIAGSIRQIDALQSQAGDLIKQMEVEVRSHDQSTRKVLLDKVNQYKKSLTTHKSDFERAKEQAQRSSLIGVRSIEDRQKYMDVNDKIKRQNDMIANATRTVAETEEVGLEITNQLQQNRETINSAHSKVRNFSGITDSARRILSSMARRDVKQRFILFFIAVVLIIAISVTAYYTSQKTKSS